jgi:diguanylate cyclase (GGDEF)-like protein
MTKKDGRKKADSPSVYHKDYRRVRFIHVTSLVLACLGFAYTVFNIIVGRYIFGWTIGAASILFLALFFLSRDISRAKLVTVLYLLLIYSQMLTSLLFSQKSNSSLVWMVFGPVITFYLTGSRTGLRVSALFIVFVSAYLALLPRSEVPFLALVNVGYALTILSVIMYFYERNRELAGDAIEKSREELYVIARTDALTGLNNRFCIDQILFTHFSTLKNPGTENVDAVTLIIVDIDHFKNINDTFGHPKGDSVLKAISLILRQSVAGRGDAGRWGGEEFLLVCRNLDLDEAYQMAESIRKHVELLQFEDPGIHVTVSLGISISRSGDDPGSLLKRADVCLYQGKSEGRNRTVTERELFH